MAEDDICPSSADYDARDMDVEQYHADEELIRNTLPDLFA